MFLPQSAPPDSLLQSIINSLPTHSYTPNSDGQPIHLLEDFKKLPLTSDTLPSPFLRILHTPGHTADSIAIYIPSDRALYTADTVLGQGTAVFEDLASLIISLRKMLDFEGYTKLYPGHGPVVDDGPALINTYIEHRMKREEEIVQVLGSDGEGDEGIWTTWTIVSKIYAAYPQNLWVPAAQSVDLHLRKLEKDEKVKHVGGEGKDGQWVLIKGKM
jgi:endoribonuclease LACTB2